MLSSEPTLSSFDTIIEHMFGFVKSESVGDSPHLAARVSGGSRHLPNASIGGTKPRLVGPNRLVGNHQSLYLAAVPLPR